MNTFTLQLILVTMLAYRRHHESFAVICICYDEKWTVYRIILSGIWRIFYRMDEKSGVEWENDFA